MDPVTLSIAGSGIASAVGGWFANRQSKEMAREAMQFSERMSSTAWQRGVEDMRKAGINPMLAASQGGASSPAGVSVGMDDVLSPAVSSALQTKRLQEDVKVMRQQAANIFADTDVKRMTNRKMRREMLLLDQQRRTAKAAEDNTTANTAMTLAELPRAENRANVERSRFGAGAAWFDRFMESLARPVGGALGIGLAGRALSSARAVERARQLRTDAGIGDLFPGRR